MSIYHDMLLARSKGNKKFAVLLDPDHLSSVKMEHTISLAIDAHVDYIFIGGSLVLSNVLDGIISDIKGSCNIPVILFPGSSFQLSEHADALLFLSLISGRNPDLLIGKHVEVAPFVSKTDLEVIPTGYMLIDGGKITSVSYMSNTIPIPHTKDDIALSTALAGQLLGLKLIYLEAGSGADIPVSEEMISRVSSKLDIPLIVGGGIRTPEKAMANVKAGADLVVIGNAIETDPQLIMDFSAAIHSVKATVT